MTVLSLSASAAPVTGSDVPVSEVAIGGTYGQPLSVASDGTDFLTLWRDVTPGREGLYATAVTETGATRPLSPTRLDYGYSSFGHAVWTGDAYLIVMTHLGGVSTLRLDRDAQVIFSRFPLPIGREFTFISDLAWNGRHALTAARSNGGFCTAVLLDAAGGVVRRVAIPYTLPPVACTAAAAGDTFVVAWTEELERFQTGIPPLTIVRAVRITEEGQVGAPVELKPATRGILSLDAATGRGEAGITVQVDRSLARYTIDETFAVHPDPVVVLEDQFFDVRTVSTAAGLAAVYTVYRGGQDRLIGSIPFHSSASKTVVLAPFPIFGFRAGSNGRTILALFGGAPLRGVALDATLSRRTSDIVPVATAAVRQSSPTIGTAGNTALYAWVEASPSFVGTVKARRFDSDGKALDAQPLTLGAGMEPLKPAIAFTGKVWIVAWTPWTVNGSRVVMKRVSPQGVVLDAAPIDIGPGAHPVIASNGKSAVVVTTDDGRRAIYMVRLSAEGVRLDPSHVTVTEPAADHPAIATNGHEYLLTWSEAYRDVVGIRLAADGTRLDAAPIAIATGPLTDSDSYVASDGNDFLVTYVSSVSPLVGVPPIEEPPPVAVYAKRVLRNGALGDTTAAQDGSRLGFGVDPAVAFKDERYLATFVRHETSGLTGLTPDTLLILAVTTNRRGQALNPPRSVVIAQSFSVMHTLATIGDSIWFAYARLTPDLGDVQRVYTREVINAVGQSRRRGVRR